MDDYRKVVIFRGKTAQDALLRTLKRLQAPLRGPSLPTPVAQEFYA